MPRDPKLTVRVDLDAQNAYDNAVEMVAAFAALRDRLAESAGVCTHPGLGQGWRLSPKGRRPYPVREHRRPDAPADYRLPEDTAALDRDSVRARIRLGIS